MKINKYLNDFLSDYVNINKTRLDTAKTNISGVTTAIENSTHYSRIIVGTSIQWSLRHKTIIKPIDEDDTFDTDLLVEIKKPVNWSYSDCITKLREVFTSHGLYKDKLDAPKTRCVTICYEWQNTIDVVPTFQEDGGYYIVNSEENKREYSDGEWFAKWFDNQNTKTGGNLKKVIRLMKYIRNYKEIFEIQSIHLNVIIWKIVDEGWDFTDLQSTLISIVNNLITYLEDKTSVDSLDLINPANENENMCEGGRNFEDKQLIAFKTFILGLGKILNSGWEDEDILKGLQVYFGEGFWEKYYDDVSHMQDYQWENIIVALGLSWKELQWQIWIVNPTFTIRGKYADETHELTSWEFMKKGVWLTFYAEVSGIYGEYKIYWQVLNTGPEATRAKAQRWEIFTSKRRQIGSHFSSEPSPDQARNMEYTSYTWTHWVKCFVVQNNKLVAESTRFHIRIKEINT